MKTLFILNDAPYGSERTYNGARLAGALARQDAHEVRVFLIGDASSSAQGGQKVPSGYYNLGTMLGTAAARGAEIGVCGTCMDARGMSDDNLVAGARRSTLDELAGWTAWADKVFVF